MGRVQKLPESLIRLIAAGEVIERPASVLKELAENSLDAGAKSLSIDFWNAGRSRIRIADDGEGMTPEDAAAALDRHATSKLKSFEDLERIGTFGFRGEALPSIAAVSRMTLITRTSDAPHAWKVRLEGGKVLESAAIGAPPGTTIEIEDLFFNVPARAKFLKKDSTERQHLLRVLQELALVHPQVRFATSWDGQDKLSWPVRTQTRDRLADVWGHDAARGLVELSAALGPARLSGWVQDIPAHHATKAYQALYVNGRPILPRALLHAIYEAFKEWLPVGRHPKFALYLDLDPRQVDINVHPAKREVRFSDERALYDFLYRTIRQRFAPASSPHLDRPTAPLVRQSFGEGGSPHLSLSPQHVLSNVLALYSPANSDNPTVADAPAAEPVFSAQGLHYLGQFQRVYLLAERGEEILLIDQHAAAERVLYENLLNAALSEKEAPRQPLLMPEVVEISATQANALRAALPELLRLGFGIDVFGPQAFAIKEWPAALPGKQARRFVEELAEALVSERASAPLPLQHEIAARAACRAAIMAGDALSPEEAAALFTDLSRCQRPMTCPHGRPTHIRLSKTELDRRFRRV